MSDSDVVNILLGLALAVLVIGALVAGLTWWLRRERRRWAREDELRRQLWEVEQQIWRESLPDWQREALDEADRRRVAIRQEARRRLGLPEDDPR